MWRVCSWQTLCDPLNSSPPPSSVHGIFPGKNLEWVAIFSSRDLPDPGVKSTSPASADGFFTTEPLGNPWKVTLCSPLYHQHADFGAWIIHRRCSGRIQRGFGGWCCNWSENRESWGWSLTRADTLDFGAVLDSWVIPSYLRHRMSGLVAWIHALLEDAFVESAFPHFSSFLWAHFPRFGNCLVSWLLITQCPHEGIA